MVFFIISGRMSPLVERITFSLAPRLFSQRPMMVSAQSFAARIVVDIGPGCIDTVASVRHIIIEHLKDSFSVSRVPKIMVPNTILILISRVKSPDVMDAYRIEIPPLFFLLALFSPILQQSVRRDKKSFYFL